MPDQLPNPQPTPTPYNPPTSQQPNPIFNPTQPQVPSPQPQNATQSPNPEPKKGSGKFMLIILIILLLVAGAAAAYFFLLPKLTGNKPQTPATSQAPQVSQATASAQPINTPPPYNPQQSQVNNPLYTSTASQFSITGPQSWNKNTNTQGAEVLFQNTQADTLAIDQTFTASINVFVEPLSKTLTLDEYSIQADTQRKQTLNAYKLISQSKGTLGNQVSKIDLFTTKIGAIDVKQGQIYTIKNQRVYIVTFSALSSVWDKYSQIFNSTAQSFNFTGN